MCLKPPESDLSRRNSVGLIIHLHTFAHGLSRSVWSEWNKTRLSASSFQITIYFPAKSLQFTTNLGEQSNRNWKIKAFRPEEWTPHSAVTTTSPPAWCLFYCYRFLVQPAEDSLHESPLLKKALHKAKYCSLGGLLTTAWLDGHLSTSYVKNVVLLKNNSTLDVTWR